MSLDRGGTEIRRDLPWLRRRRLPGARSALAPDTATPASSGASAGGSPLDLTPLDRSASDPTPVRRASPDPTPVDRAPPDRSPLDLSAPDQPPMEPALPDRTVLDLSTPGPPARPLPPAGITGPASVRTLRPARSAAAGDPVLCYPPVRVRAGRAVVLTEDEPTVALTNVQSAIGALTVRAVCSEAVGDLRLACAYGLQSGRSSMISTTEGHRLAPPRSARPVLVAQRDRYEGITVDLLQIRELQRFVVLAFSASGAALRWSGALVAETLGARVDVPLDRPAAPGVLAVLSAYAVDGQLVLRAERELIIGSARDACLAYGFEHITWVDPWTPLA